MKYIKKGSSYLLIAAMLLSVLFESTIISMAASDDHIIINQLYGGGGKGDGPFSNSFIELYNPTAEDVSLGGYKVTYSSNRENASAKHAGSTWVDGSEAEVKSITLSGTIKAGSSYLIRCAAEDTDVAVFTLQNADLDWNQVIDNDLSVEVILYKDTTLIDAISTREADFRDVGEGTSPATTDISKQKSLRRSNFTDTNNNAADYKVVTWNELSTDETEKQAFIAANKPRSGIDGAWTESNSNVDSGNEKQTLFLNGFENDSAIDMEKLGSYITGTSNADGGVAEIISYDSKNNKAWVVNGTTGMLDILDLSDITSSKGSNITAESVNVQEIIEASVDGFQYGDMTSVSVNSENGLIAVAIQEADYKKNGKIAVFNTEKQLIALFEAGVQPDMVTFTPDGKSILSANEGEPREGYGTGITDPNGSVTIISINASNISASAVNTVDFSEYDNARDELVNSGVILKKDVSVSADLEPEYIACDNSKAYIALQEANAIAVLDITTKKYIGLYSLGYKDLSLSKNAIDLLEDNSYTGNTYENTVAAYMPDGISIYSQGGKTYLVTANEGDAREWGDYLNEVKTTLTATDLTTAKSVRAIDSSTTDGLPDGKSVLFGGRSFSIYEINSTGLTQVYDSANQFESLTYTYLSNYFNASNDDNEFDSRSRKKGPEPENVTVGTIDGKVYAFVGLERIGGIMVYDVTNPSSSVYCNYINTRDFSEEPGNAVPNNAATALSSDIAPEGLYFINSTVSASGTPILLGAFEVSGTVAAYSIGLKPDSNVAPKIDAENGKTYCGTTEVTVTDINLGTVTVNGKQISVTKDGKFKVSPATGEQTIVATDKAGKSTTITITVNDGHIWDAGNVIEEATVSETGKVTYTCTICGETNVETIAKLSPTMIEGMNSQYTQGGKNGLSFRSDAELEDLLGVLIDGVEIATDKYTATSGSTIITLKPEFLDTLSTGTHTVSIESVSGTVTTEFAIKEKTADNNTKDTGSAGTSSSEDESIKAPQTGDTSNVSLWICLMIFFGGAIIVLTIMRKRKMYRE